MKRILIPVMSQQDCEFLSKLSARLEADGFAVTCVPRDRYTQTTVDRYFEESTVATDYLTHDPERSLDALLTKYDVESPKSLVFPQMVTDGTYPASGHGGGLFGTTSVEFDPYWDVLHRTLDFLDNLFEEGRGGTVLQHSGGEVLRRVAQRVADHHGHETIWVGFSPISDHCSLYDNEMANWDSFDQESSFEATEEELQRARQFRDNLLETNLTIHRDSESHASIVSRLRDNVERKLYRIQSYDYDIVPLARRFLTVRARKLRRQARQRYVKSVYLNEHESREVLDSTRYVFFPLQFYKESRITVRAPEFYDQAWLVEYLARSLPSGYELVVKDHPFQLGKLPLGSVRSIAEHATAIDPDIHAHDVIEGADAVVTINNTVGFESLVFGKPVVSLGEAFYDGCGYTVETTDVRELPELIRRAIDSTGLSEDEVLELTARTLRGSYEGDWFDPSEDNVRVLANSVSKNLSQI